MKNMPFCSKCGKELDEETVFCPKCGTPTGKGGITYNRGRGWSSGQIIALFIGGIMVISGFGVFVGGAILSTSKGWLTDSNGFINSKPLVLQTQSTLSYAIVQQNIDVNLEPLRMWRITNNDIVTMKIIAENYDPNKAIFIGVAPAIDANNYLSSVSYDRLINTSWSLDRSIDNPIQPTYKNHPGSAPTLPPTSIDIWIKSVQGTGTQTLEWVPTTGNYWIVLMNANGSSTIDATVQVGAKIPILGGIGNILIALGVVVLILGGLIIYYGGIRQR